MRNWIDLFERAASQTYFHITDVRNVPAILKKGLVPNLANDGNGNYESGEWSSLEGVYVTRESDIIEQYMFAHNLRNYAIVVVAVTPQSALPDEDVIPVLIEDIFDKVMTKRAGRAEDWAYDMDAVYDVAFGGEEPDGDGLPMDIYREVAAAFHERAKGNDPRPADMEDLVLMVECWWDFKIGIAGDAAMIWPELKDRIVRRYPKIAHPSAGAGYSLRIPGTVGFGGRNRITAIVTVIDGVGKLVYGTLNEDAIDFLGEYAPDA